MAAFALVAMPTAGQAPAPPCPAGAQVPPDRFEFTEDPDEPFIYEFKVGVLAYPPHGRGRARRGVEITLSQRSRTLATFRFVTSCSAPIGGLECAPLPKEAPRP